MSWFAHMNIYFFKLYLSLNMRDIGRFNSFLTSHDISIRKVYLNRYLDPFTEVIIVETSIHTTV